MTKDPLNKLREKMKNRNIKFSLKTVTETQVKKIMEKMKKKKSSGVDGVSQECLLLGKDVLSIPLTRIINSSISEGIVPEVWKESVVTPLLKKGDPKEKSNYRPLSCLKSIVVKLVYVYALNDAKIFFV